ncbi:3-phosphoshikimate 1-carboxyvinyltransferase [Helicobacter sp. T3_23-1059]
MIRISPQKSSFCLEIDSIAPDKSISHRSAMFALLCDKPSVVYNYLQAQDTLNTLNIAKALGLSVKSCTDSNGKIMLKLTPPKDFIEPNCVLDCGNAGTAMRLYIGLLAGLAGSKKYHQKNSQTNNKHILQDFDANSVDSAISNDSSGFYAVLSGDRYLCARPMNRVILPLQNIGATIFSRSGGLAPLSIISKQLDGFSYTSKIASAQVKSALILSALHARSESTYIEPTLTRAHTESMLLGMNAPIKIENLSDTNTNKNLAKQNHIIQNLATQNLSGRKIHISPLERALEPLDFSVPCDPSSAFYFALATAITPHSEILLKNVALNPTRIEAYKVLEKMGAKVRYENIKTQYEEIGDIYVASGNLAGVKVEENIAWLIDELPALSIAMALANGVSEVKNAKELRVKESDRIKAVLCNLSALGVEYEEKDDGYVIYGGGFFRHTKKLESSIDFALDSSNTKSNHKKSNLTNKIPQIKSFGDHRIAMSFAIAGIITPLQIDDESCINISFPNFLQILSQIANITTS